LTEAEDLSNHFEMAVFQNISITTSYKSTKK